MNFCSSVMRLWTSFCEGSGRLLCPLSAPMFTCIGLQYLIISTKELRLNFMIGSIVMYFGSVRILFIALARFTGKRVDPISVW